MLVSRLVVLMWLLESAGVVWFLEQPAGSLMQEHPRLRQFMERVAVHRRSLRGRPSPDRDHTCSPTCGHGAGRRLASPSAGSGCGHAPR